MTPDGKLEVAAPLSQTMRSQAGNRFQQLRVLLFLCLALQIAVSILIFRFVGTQAWDDGAITLA